MSTYLPAWTRIQFMSNTLVAAVRRNIVVVVVVVAFIVVVKYLE